MTDETPGITPGEVEGHVPPATPDSEMPPSEIPTGVDELPAEAVAAAEEAVAAAEEAAEDAPQKADVEAQVAPDAGEAS
jgi:hypothetical protein